MQVENSDDDYFHTLIRDVWPYEFMKNNPITTRINHIHVLDKVEYSCIPFTSRLNGIDNQPQVVGHIIDISKAILKEETNLKRQYCTLSQAKEKQQELSIVRNMIFTLFADSHIREMSIEFCSWRPVLTDIIISDPHIEKYKDLFQTLVAESWIIRNTTRKWYKMMNCIIIVNRRTSYCFGLVDHYKLNWNNYENGVSIYNIPTDELFIAYCNEDADMFIKGELSEKKFVTILRSMCYNELIALENEVYNLQLEFSQFMYVLKNLMSIPTFERPKVNIAIMHLYCLEMYIQMCKISANDIYTYNGFNIEFNVEYTLNKLRDLLNVFQKVIYDKRNSVAELNTEMTTVLRACNPADIITYHTEELNRVTRAMGRHFSWNERIYYDILAIEKHLNKRRRI